MSSSMCATPPVKRRQLHLDVTRRLLQDLGCQDRPILPVLNKCDLVPSMQDIPLIGSAVRISAKTGEGLKELLKAVEEALPVRVRTVRLLIPFGQAGLCAQLREKGNLLSEEFTEEGIPGDRPGRSPDVRQGAGIPVGIKKKTVHDRIFHKKGERPAPL